MNSPFRPIAPDTTNPGGDGIEVGSEEARGGSTSRVTRTMLGWGLLLVIIAFALLFGIGHSTS
jgi:hypothetical protein